MITFKEFIGEAKQVGTIFHFTTLSNLDKILKTDPPFLMSSQNGETLSASRNSSLNLTNIHFKECNVVIYLDGDKLSEHHKIRPVAGFAGNQRGVLDIRTPHSRVIRDKGEAEEAILTLPINIRKYIKHIHIQPSHVNMELYEPVIKKLNELGITHGYGRHLTHPIKEEFDLKDEKSKGAD